MEYQDVKDWLDALIDINNKAKSLEYLNSNIQAIVRPMMEIHIYKGIEIIADVMGFQLSEKKFNNKKMEYSFIYSNVEFYQIGSSDDEDKS